jgi:hypothetical protein
VEIAAELAREEIGELTRAGKPLPDPATRLLLRPGPVALWQRD